MRSHDVGISRIYLVTFFLALLGLSLLPIIFSWSKATKNPEEFRPEEKRYAIVEAIAGNVAPDLANMIKAEDCQKDQNGEENVTVLAVKGISPNVAGHIMVDGQEKGQIVSGRKDVSITLKIRYDRAGDIFMMHLGDTKVRVGEVFAMKNRDYLLPNIEMLKVTVGDDKDNKGDK